MDRRVLLQGLAALGAVGETAAAATSHSAAPLQWPSSEVLRLWPGHAPGHDSYQRPVLAADWPSHFLRGIEVPEIHVFRAAHPNGKSVLVCPGGAYLFVSIENEGLDVARVLNAMGITVFVLAYRLPCEGWQQRQDVPLQDAQRAMRLLRHHAVALDIDPSLLGVMGFSAGGHLAATLTTAWAEPVYTPLDAADDASARPAHSALLYPVITLTDPWTHADSRRYLLGEQQDSASILRRSPESHVSAETPRCFIAHAADDGVVPVEHARLWHRALTEAHIGSELHLFEHGDHAFGMGREGTGSALWPLLYERWLSH